MVSLLPVLHNTLENKELPKMLLSLQAGVCVVEQGLILKYKVHIIHFYYHTSLEFLDAKFS